MPPNMGKEGTQATLFPHAEGPDGPVPLHGVVDYKVYIDAQFTLSAAEHHLGGNVGFHGELAYPLPDTCDLDAGMRLTGWGCIIYSTYHVLRMFGYDVSLERVMQLSMACEGGDEQTTDEAVADTFACFGITIKTIKVSSSHDLKKYLEAGCLFMAVGWEMDWDKMADLSYRADNAVHADDNQTKYKQCDGHVTVVAGVDDDGNSLVINSTLRPFTKNGPTYGIMTLTPDGFRRAMHDFYGKLSNDGMHVGPGAEWYHMTGWVVIPPWVQLDDE